MKSANILFGFFVVLFMMLWITSGVLWIVYGKYDVSSAQFWANVAAFVLFGTTYLLVLWLYFLHTCGDWIAIALVIAVSCIALLLSLQSYVDVSTMNPLTGGIIMMANANKKKTNTS